jgi:AcrR family transcriptional regulator
MTTRERILDAALECFAEQGYSRTSMRELAARVEMRAPSLYNHFASKREIMQALLERSGPGRMTRLIDALPEEMPAAALIETVLEGLFALWRDPQDNRSMRLVCAEALHDAALGEMLEAQVFRQERDQIRGLLLRAAPGTSAALAEQWADLCVALAFAHRLQLLLSGEHPEKAETIIRQSRQQFLQLARLLDLPLTIKAG